MGSIPTPVILPERVGSARSDVARSPALRRSLRNVGAAYDVLHLGLDRVATIAVLEGNGNDRIKHARWPMEIACALLKMVVPILELQSKSLQERDPAFSLGSPRASKAQCRIERSLEVERKKTMVVSPAARHMGDGRVADLEAVVVVPVVVSIGDINESVVGAARPLGRGCCGCFQRS